MARAIRFRFVFAVVVVGLLLDPVFARAAEKKSSGSAAKSPGLLNTPCGEKAAQEKQQAWAKFLGLQTEETNSLGMKLVLIPPGRFTMGASPADLRALLSVDSEAARDLADFDKHLMTHGVAKLGDFDGTSPQHPVTLNRPIYMAATETTRKQFLAFYKEANPDAVRDSPRGTQPGKTRFDPPFPQSDEHPVIRIQWDDAVAFCEWLSKKEGVRYRLPTEAEWEYACRAGKKTLWQHGITRVGIEEIGNSSGAVKSENAAKFQPKTQQQTVPGYVFLDGYFYTAPVGKFKPNAFGLFDMHGNVWEWCSDRFDIRYYRNSPALNPQGPTTGEERVGRGGSWYVPVMSTSSVVRLHWNPKQITDDIGFRVVREVEVKTK